VKRKIIFSILGLLALLLALAQSNLLIAAQTGGAYTLAWSTIDGGGAMSSAGGAFALSGTIGQPDAGTASGANYTLASGFWGSVLADAIKLYLPMILKTR
jgi:hypothetical protein